MHMYMSMLYVAMHMHMCMDMLYKYSSYMYHGHTHTQQRDTGGVNFNSVQVAKRPISPTASAGRSAVTSCLIDEYTTKNNY